MAHVRAPCDGEGALAVRFHRLGGLFTWELNGDNAAGDLFMSMYASLTAPPPDSDPCTR